MIVVGFLSGCFIAFLLLLFWRWYFYRVWPWEKLPFDERFIVLCQENMEHVYLVRRVAVKMFRRNKFVVRLSEAIQVGAEILVQDFRGMPCLKICKRTVVLEGFSDPFE